MSKGNNKVKDNNKGNLFIDMISNIRVKFMHLLSKNKKMSIIVGASLLLLVCIFIIVICKRKYEFVLNEIYDIYPEQVRELYANMVEVSCSGDLKFNALIDNGTLSINKINKNDLLLYLFSNLDKDNKLTDNISTNFIKMTSNSLFNQNIDLLSEIKDFQYGDYVYNVKDNKVIRKSIKCVSDDNYISNLYGYSYNKNMLSIDVNFGYLKGDVLYNLNDKKLGTYNGDASKLFDLFNTSPYYRLNYVKKGKLFKLDSIQLKNRT